jgi:SOS-response transcriptional repressor LexA
MKNSDRIKTIRETIGVSQTDFARVLGVAPSFISGIERGKKDVSRELLQKLLEKYQININFLLSGSGKMFLYQKDEESENPPQILKLGAMMDQRLETIESRMAEIESRLREISKGTTDPDRFVSDPEPEYCHIPFMENVAAGPPIAQSEDLSDYMKVPRQFFKKKRIKPEDCYAVRVIGESMTDRIPDGSIVLIRKSDRPKNGAIQVVRHGGKSTLKRMREHEDHSWTLQYEDGSGRCIELGQDEEYQAQGDFVDIMSEEEK